MVIPEFVNQLQSKYEAALSNQSLFFTPTSTSYTNSSAGIQFQIRCITSLSNKPIANQDTLKKPNHDDEKDPFAPPYHPDLLLCQFGIDGNDRLEQDSYVVLLNKFCVVPRHFLLVTQEFKSQNSPPSPTDLYAIRLILQQTCAREHQNEWIAFYNSGPESGASQLHKHFQFIPVEKGSSPFGKLIERYAPAREGQIFDIPGLSYSHFIVSIPPTFSSSNDSESEEMEIKLGRLFMGLLDSMIDRLRHLPSSSSSPSSNEGSSTKKTLSYNFVMTQKYMMLVPRSNEFFIEGNQEHSQLKISINSLGVGAGMILVKSLESLERLQKIGVDNLLASVTFPALKEVIDPCSQG